MTATIHWSDNRHPYNIQISFSGRAVESQVTRAIQSNPEGLSGAVGYGDADKKISLHRL